MIAADRFPMLWLVHTGVEVEVEVDKKSPRRRLSVDFDFDASVDDWTKL